MLTLAILLGHLVGDYLFQTNWMATNKVRDDAVGFFACGVHCLCYAVTFGMAFYLLLEISISEAIVVAFIAFVAHYPIDKYSLGKWWLSMLGNTFPRSGDIISIRCIFSLFVYIVVDNTMHLVLTVAGIAWLLPGLLK